jgi:hypothetical protein
VAAVAVTPTITTLVKAATTIATTPANIAGPNTQLEGHQATAMFGHMLSGSTLGCYWIHP